MGLVMFAGTTETVEGRDKLSARLCTPVVFCQSARRRAGETILLCFTLIVGPVL